MSQLWCGLTAEPCIKAGEPASDGIVRPMPVHRTRNKMRLQWIFIFLLLSCWITPTEETEESWDLSALLSTLLHRDHEMESETLLERRLSRRKRATSNLCTNILKSVQLPSALAILTSDPRVTAEDTEDAVVPTVERGADISEYTVDIEISFPDASFVNQIKQLVNNQTFPIPLGVSDAQINSIEVTTACNQTGSDVHCSCESGYIWDDAVCKSYDPCAGYSTGNCNCINGTSIPAQYCQPRPVSINMSLRLLETFTADLKDNTSTKYKAYKTDLDAQIYNAYKSLSGFRSGNVTNFSNGSVVVDYTLVTEPTSTTAITTANQNLLNSLAATYSVDPVIKTIITDKSNITVSPSSIFIKDTVFLTCTVNITSFSNVSWYHNDTEAVPSSLYTAQVVGSSVQSILTINGASLSTAGTYRCTVDNGSTSYPAETTIAVQPLDVTILNTNIGCNDVAIPVLQCCTQGISMDYQMTCAVKSGKD
ncbi:unnamed protein product, partial [Ranitomeya imitator]